jgi:hypothetical protein
MPERHPGVPTQFPERIHDIGGKLIADAKDQIIAGRTNEGLSACSGVRSPASWLSVRPLSTSFGA